MRERRVVHRSPAEVLETLVHEMANASLFLLACRYKLCQKQKGAEGRGAMWQELRQAVYGPGNEKLR